jgi:hypothetical protein
MTTPLASARTDRPALGSPSGLASRPGDPSDKPLPCWSYNQSVDRQAGSFHTHEALRARVREFARTYNQSWLLERHAYRTPTEAREHLIRQALVT